MDKFYYQITYKESEVEYILSNTDCNYYNVSFSGGDFIEFYNKILLQCTYKVRKWYSFWKDTIIEYTDSKYTLLYSIPKKNIILIKRIIIEE